MDTNSLLYFAEAAKDLNFTRTAKRLFISQQNLSNHISRLEDYYRVKLFERKPHLALTYSGEVLLAAFVVPSTPEEAIASPVMVHTTIVSQKVPVMFI